MAIVYSSGLRNTRLDAVDTAIGSSGWLIIADSSLYSTTVWKKKLNNPAFAAASTNTIALSTSGISTTAIADKTISHARILAGSSAGTAIVTGLTISTSGGGGDMIVSNVSVSSGQTITVKSAIITHG